MKAIEKISFLFLSSDGFTVDWELLCAGNNVVWRENGKDEQLEKKEKLFALNEEISWLLNFTTEFILLIFSLAVSPLCPPEFGNLRRRTPTRTAMLNCVCFNFFLLSPHDDEGDQKGIWFHT